MPKPKQMDFYGGNDTRSPMTPGDQVVAVFRDPEKGKLIAFRMKIGEAEQALNDLNSAIMRAIDVNG